MLVIIPDGTRTAPIGTLVKEVYKILVERVQCIHLLVALGTHPPMSRFAILGHLALDEQTYADQFNDLRFFNHEWDKAEMLVQIGVLDREFIARASAGYLNEEVVLRINKRILDYDHLIVLGPVFPHEIAGFSGGSKYFFPGISGQEIIDVTHWLGALIGNMNVIGRKDTAVRRIIDEAAKKIPKPVHCVSFVVHHGRLVELYVGSVFESWRQAVELSAKLHIVRKPRTFQRVLAQAPTMYEDLWTGGKCVYKTEGVVEDSGEIVIFAPHIDSLSYTHGHLLEKIGYHTSEYFMRNMKMYSKIPRSVMAVSAYIKGRGTYRNGVEKTRIKVTVASRIPAALCRKVGLGYLDPDSIDLDDWKEREDEGILYIEKAGETLYLLDEAPTAT